MMTLGLLEAGIRLYQLLERCRCRTLRLGAAVRIHAKTAKPGSNTEQSILHAPTLIADDPSPHKNHPARQ